MNDFIDNYSVLRLSSDADEIEVRSAYRELASIYHPDKNSSIKASIEFKKIHNAYLILSNPLLKSNYDKQYIIYLKEKYERLNNIYNRKKLYQEKVTSSRKKEKKPNNINKTRKIFLSEKIKFSKIVLLTIKFILLIFGTILIATSKEHTSINNVEGNNLNSTTISTTTIISTLKLQY